MAFGLGGLTGSLTGAVGGAVKGGLGKRRKGPLLGAVGALTGRAKTKAPRGGSTIGKMAGALGGDVRARPSKRLAPSGGTGAGLNKTAIPRAPGVGRGVGAVGALRESSTQKPKRRKRYRRGTLGGMLFGM